MIYPAHLSSRQRKFSPDQRALIKPARGDAVH
jgi:hypothetical protein